MTRHRHEMANSRFYTMVALTAFLAVLIAGTLLSLVHPELGS